MIAALPHHALLATAANRAPPVMARLSRIVRVNDTLCRSPGTAAELAAYFDASPIGDEPGPGT